MYLDTDIILSQIKQEDWLKERVGKRLSQINEALVTSSITVIEGQIILLREVSRDDAVSALDKVKELNVVILPLTERVLEVSKGLLAKYSKLNIFDSIHLANAVLEDGRIMSTDHLFDEIEEVERIDPL